jgi:hypothetical protein
MMIAVDRSLLLTAMPLELSMRTIPARAYLNCLVFAVAFAALAHCAHAQEVAPAARTPAARTPSPTAVASSDANRTTAARRGFRRIAPGVEVTIPPDRKEEETYSVHSVTDLIQGVPNLKWQPKESPSTRTLYEMATNTVFRHKVWGLEFTFKPVRMIYVDVPQTSGKMQRKLIWYMVYHVKNTGGHLQPKRNANGTYDIVKVDEPVTFNPHFVLESHEYDKAYLDRLIPVAVPVIQAKEDPNRRLLNSVEMGEKPIPVSTDKLDKSVWGVAMWEDVDPRVDFFSVFVQGLTNAVHWEDSKDFKPGDPPGKGRVITQKTLLLNFWRPGEEYLEHERIIQYGIPGKVDYAWVYR